MPGREWKLTQGVLWWLMVHDPFLPLLSSLLLLVIFHFCLSVAQSTPFPSLYQAPHIFSLFSKCRSSPEYYIFAQYYNFLSTVFHAIGGHLQV